MAKLFTIKSAAAEFGMSQVYIRRAIREGDLNTEMQPISEGSKIEQHVFTEEDWKAWRASVSQRSHREDGRRKYVLYADMEDEIATIKEAVSAALPDFNVDELITIANPPKS